MFQSTATYYILERPDRYEINSEAITEDEQLRDIRLLYQWLRSVRTGVLKEQVFVSYEGAETVYLFKQPTRVELEQDSLALEQSRSPRVPLRG